MRRLWPPLLALLLARIATAAAAVWAGVDPLRAGSWIRYDSNLYLDLSRQGYTLFPCPPGSKYEAWQWCGNAGWFPLYAWLRPLPRDDHLTRVTNDWNASRAVAPVTLKR